MEESVFNLITTMLKERQDECQQAMNKYFMDAIERLAEERLWSMLERVIDEIEQFEEYYIGLKEEMEFAEKNNEGLMPINKNSKKPPSDVEVLVCSNCGWSILHWSSRNNCWLDEWNKKCIGNYTAWRPLPPTYRPEGV